MKSIAKLNGAGGQMTVKVNESLQPRIGERYMVSCGESAICGGGPIQRGWWSGSSDQRKWWSEDDDQDAINRNIVLDYILYFFNNSLICQLIIIWSWFYLSGSSPSPPPECFIQIHSFPSNCLKCSKIPFSFSQSLCFVPCWQSQTMPHPGHTVRCWPRWHPTQRRHSFSKLR